MKKIVWITALTFGALVTSCNKKVEKSNDNQMTNEQVTQEVADSIKTDTVASMVEPKDTISKK